MSREKGIAPFSAFFEPQSATPLDARQLVQTKADLTDPSTWLANDQISYVYPGMITVVSSDPVPANNGVYLLKALPVTNISNWGKLGDSTASSFNNDITLNFSGYYFSTGYCNHLILNYSSQEFGFAVPQDMILSSITFRSYTPTNRIIEVRDETNTILYSFPTPSAFLTLTPNTFISANKRISLFITGPGFYKYFNVQATLSFA